MIPSTASSSVITSSDSELMLAPFRSNKSQATPSSSVARRQCNHVDEAPEPGPNSSSLSMRASRTLLFMTSSRCLDQHRAALAAADAFGRYSTLLAKAPHRIDEMQHDPIAAGADRMAETNRATVDVEPRAIDDAGSTIETQHVAAKVLLLPGSETSEHLGREGFVELPKIDIA